MIKFHIYDINKAREEEEHSVRMTYNPHLVPCPRTQNTCTMFYRRGSLPCYKLQAIFFLAYERHRNLFSEGTTIMSYSIYFFMFYFFLADLRDSLVS